MRTRWIWAVCATVLVISLAPAQQKTGVVGLGSSQPGRFQLESVEVSENTNNNSSETYHEMFVIDSQTGRVWHYSPVQPMVIDGKKNLSDEVLVEVDHFTMSGTK